MFILSIRRSVIHMTVAIFENHSITIRKRKYPDENKRSFWMYWCSGRSMSTSEHQLLGLVRIRTPTAWPRLESALTSEHHQLLGLVWIRTPTAWPRPGSALTDNTCT
jgi:hypothetical protein